MAKQTPPNQAQATERFDAFSVREYEHQGKTETEWLKVGVAFPHKDGEGFNVDLHAVPVNGKIVLRKYVPKAD